MGPYLSRTPMRVRRVFHRGSSGAVGSYRLKSGFRRVSVGTQIWHDRPRRGSMGRSTVLYPCMTKIWTRAHRAPPVAPGATEGSIGTWQDPGGRPAAPSDPVS